MLRRFFSYYRPYRGLFILDFSCAILSGLLELGFPMAVKLFVDRLLLSHEWLLILLASAALLAIYVVNTGLMTVVTYWAICLASISRQTCAARRSIICRSCLSAISTTRRPDISSGG